MEIPTTSKENKRSMIGRLLIGMLITIMLALNLSLGKTSTSIVKAQSPTPTPDRLLEPNLSENPTQYEQGRHLYWYHCMPCHGDLGQGLTDEFINLWPEDHQNCWGRGCHGGRAMDEGFTIPRTIPAVIFSSGNMAPYPDSEELYEYLYTTHPPQYPGHLLEDEYWAVTAYVLAENGFLSSNQEIGPQAEATATRNLLVSGAIGLTLLIVSAIIIRIKIQRKTSTPPTL